MQNTLGVKSTNAIPTGNPIGWFVRMAICLCSFGFIYPNAMIEGLDIAAIDAEIDRKAKEA